MKPKTVDFLNAMFWCMDALANPTFRNLTDSYESWSYRRGFVRQVDRLERARFVERRQRHQGVREDRLYRLTALGRLQVLRGRDPQARWARPWDGHWRLVLFDVPVLRDTYRKRLRRCLLDRGFGCLQGSVWVTPDSIEQERQHLAAGDIDVKSLILVEGRMCAGEPDEKIVAAAWNFEAINHRYKKHLKLLQQRPEASVSSEAEARLLHAWAVEEREGWWEAVRSDPLLPELILPDGYLGKEAWQQRIQSLRIAGRQIQAFAGLCQ